MAAVRFLHMFTPLERKELRESLIEAARNDALLVGAALVGSAATGREDAWSDIDLALQVSGDAEPSEVADRWTAQFYAQHGAVHHVDLVADGVLYRVFLLKSSLQVDVSFWPEGQFRATEPGFKLLFGSPRPATSAGAMDAANAIGVAWLYALHARSAIARDRTWQAIMMLDLLRDQILALGCLSRGLNPHHGREADRLPSDLLDALTEARARSTEASELARSNAALLQLLTDEIGLHDTDLARRMATPLIYLARARR